MFKKVVCIYLCNDFFNYGIFFRGNEYYLIDWFLVVIFEKFNYVGKNVGF